MSEYEFSGHIVVERVPDEVDDLVAGVPRTGQWSPICRSCWWEDGAGPEVGAWSGGRNETPDRTWETRPQVVAAQRGREFAWKVGGTYSASRPPLPRSRRSPGPAEPPIGYGPNREDGANTLSG